jgi:putative addiction module component (TIGR02574 family)
LAKPPALPPPGFKALPVKRKIEYVQNLWDLIATDVDQVPLEDWHKKLLDERLADHRAHPELARPWSEVRRRVLKNLRSRRRRS